MKGYKFLLVLIFLISAKTLLAQERVDHQKMNYLFNPKQNAVLYNDTLYKGSNQFAQLFYRTRDIDLINLYQRHQSNKVWGNIFGTVGALATGFGVAYATSSGNNKTAGWITLGSGLACTIFGTYLIQAGQKNMLMAVQLFNQKYNKNAVGIGISGNSAGLVVNF